MLAPLLTVLAMSWPRPAPTIDRQCINAWPKAKSPAAEQTDRCIDFVLAVGYGPDWDASSLTLDPQLVGLLTIEVPTDALEAMATQVQKVCTVEDGESAPRPADQGAAKRFDLAGDAALDDLWEWRCARAAEVMGRELAAKMAVSDVSDSINMPDAVGVYKRLFAGKALSEDALLPRLDDDGTPMACYSRATLWKFRNAPYARHGMKFKTEDLNRFFYGKRKAPITDEFDEPVKLLPLREGTRDKVELTPVDHKNVAQVIKAQKACYGE